MQRYYEADVAINCLPSLHVASFILSALFLYEDTRKEYGWMALTTAILISISTIFVRQHYVLDIPAGILHALFVYWISKRLIGTEPNKPYIDKKLWRAISILVLVLVPILTSAYLLMESKSEDCCDNDNTHIAFYLPDAYGGDSAKNFVLFFAIY